MDERRNTVSSDAEFAYDLVAREISDLNRPDLMAQLDILYIDTFERLERSQDVPENLAMLPAVRISEYERYVSIMMDHFDRLNNLVDGDDELTFEIYAEDASTIPVRNRAASELWSYDDFVTSSYETLMSIRDTTIRLRYEAEKNGFCTLASLDRNISRRTMSL